MSRLLIIDDDIMIREGIKCAIDWKEHGIDSVRTAENGEEGWKIFKTFQPDIVLTDIRMPEKDGLELLDEIKELRKETKVIILSGYDDFSYAQIAIKAGASDYLLKTSGANQLLEAIDRLNQEIEKDRSENELNSKLKEQLSMSLPLLRYRYLNELINACTDYEMLAEKMAFIDIKFECNYFMVAIAEIENIALSDDSSAEEERLLTKLRVINSIEAVIGSNGICFESKNEEFVILYFCDTTLNIDKNKEILFRICETLEKVFSSTLNLSCSFGLGNIGYGLESVKACYDEAKRALEHRLHTGWGSIIDIRDIESFTAESYRLDCDMENKLMSALRVGDKVAVLKIIEVIFGQMKLKKNLGITNFHKICIELLSIASRVLYEFDSEIEEIFGKEFQYFEETQKYKNIDYAKVSMLINFERITAFIFNTKILKAKKIIEVARKYIDENFQKDLTLNSVSEKVYMSPNYFSSLFSNEMKQSFLEYVTMRRIERAKQLLGERDSKVFEVGERVGYDNPNYFSRIFKKSTGVSPMEYKERMKPQ